MSVQIGSGAQFHKLCSDLQNLGMSVVTDQKNTTDYLVGTTMMTVAQALKKLGDMQSSITTLDRKNQIQAEASKLLRIASDNLK